MIIGTSHFKSFAAAVRYYRPYGFDRVGVQQKLDEGEIHIGPPKLKDGDTLRLIDGGTRYEITEAEMPKATFIETHLYDSLREAGIATDHHESDLYFPVTEESTVILARYPMLKRSATRFTNQQNGELWYDVPFAYAPWWEAKTR